MAGFGRNGRNFWQVWQVLFSCLPEFSAKNFSARTTVHTYFVTRTQRQSFSEKKLFIITQPFLKRKQWTYVHTRFVRTVIRGHENFYTTDNRLQNTKAVISSTVFPAWPSEKFCSKHQQLANANSQTVGVSP